MSQILLQKSLNPQQLRSQNETLIAQIKASELFVLHHLNHPSPPSVPGAQGIDCDHELAHPPSTLFNLMAPGYLVYRDPDPPTPLFSENDVQEQQVVSNKENVGHEQTDNSRLCLQQHCEESISSFENPIDRNYHSDIIHSSENIPFSNDRDLVEELQGPER